jgi:hypothetical protein
LNRKVSDNKYFANFVQSVADDGDAAVDGGIEAKVVVAGFARAERAGVI